MNESPPNTPANGQPLVTTEEERALAAVAHEAIVETRRNRRWKIFFRLLFVAVLALWLLTPLLGNKFSARGQQHIAVVNVHGVIAADAEANANDIISALQEAFKNDHVAAVFVDINSGGGSPVQAGQVYRAIKALRKTRNLPVYALIGDVGASGAYYIAAAADKIYADPASIVGSIGVISQSLGYEELANKLGLQARIFTAGAHKNFLGGNKPLEPAEVAHMQTMLDDLHQQFITAVKEGRGARLHVAQYPELFSGLFWSGDKARAIGLIDDFGDDFSLRQTGALRDLPLVNYSRALSPIDKLLHGLKLQAAMAISQGLQSATTTRFLAQ